MTLKPWWPLPNKHLVAWFSQPHSLANPICIYFSYIFTLSNKKQCSYHSTSFDRCSKCLAGFIRLLPFRPFYDYVHFCHIMTHSSWVGTQRVLSRRSPAELKVKGGIRKSGMCVKTVSFPVVMLSRHSPAELKVEGGIWKSAMWVKTISIPIACNHSMDMRW